MNTIVKSCFNITGRGIVVELQHDKNGLKHGIKLKSKYSDDIWEVRGRLIYSHVENHKIFENENTILIKPSFSNIKKLNSSKNKILESEKDNIYQYLIQNLADKNKKPANGEIFEIID